MTDRNLTANKTGASGSSYMPDVAPLSIGLVLATLAIVLNGFLILVMIRERKIFFNTRVSYFIINLAVVDCLAGLSTAYLGLHEILQLEKSHPVRRYVVLLNWTTVQGSFLTLLLMSLDRLVIVVYSLSWSNILTIGRTIISIGVIWLVSVAGAITMHFYSMQTRLAIVIFVELCILMFVGNSLFIYPVLRKREQRQFISVASTQSMNQRSLRTPQHDKMSTVVIILMGVIIITQLPFILCYQLWLIHHLIDNKLLQNIHEETYLKASLYSHAFACLNFVVNPIVYAWRIRKYRKAFFKSN